MAVSQTGLRYAMGIKMKNIRTITIALILIAFMITGCSKAGTGSLSPITTLPSVTPEEMITSTPQVTPTQAAIPPTTTPQVTKPLPTLTPIPKSYEELAEEILLNMTLEEKIGQMFFVRCNNETAVSDIETFHLGGYILFAVDFEGKSSDDIKNTLQGYQDVSKIPMLIGVDEEGGSVNRISKYPQFRSVPFRSPQSLYQEGGLDLVKSDATEKSLLLKNLGINVNLAPVCDVSTNSKDFIYSRSFGKDATESAEYVKTVVTEMNNQGIGSTLKHFPGYGSNVDTHTGIAIDERSYNTFIKSDFIPFQAGIDAGAGSILVSHNIVKGMDETLPASLSPKTHKILRDELGFNGVIMTDDLTMDAIKQYTNDEEAAILAITAGNDLIIASDFDVQIPAVIAAINNNTITEERINESVKRVLVWKLSLGLIS